LKPENYERYKKYHAEIWPEVAEMITACGIRNYSIFHRNGQLFAYMEYVGDDFDADMEKMAADPKTQEWWAIMKPMQDPLADREPDEWWADMEELFHQD
jgi:L-rhamnose mutarotase